MNSAIFRETGKEYFAWQIWKPGLFETIHKKGLWIASIDDIENYDDLTEKDIYTTPVKPHQRKNSFIPSMFRLYPGKSDNVILVKESELHKRGKTIIAVLLTETFNCSLKYDKETYLISELPIDFEKLKQNIKKREVTKTITSTDEYKRADVLIPFIFSPYWGNGLAIEIRVSEGEEKIEEKEKFWFQRGYSLIWIDEDDFITDEGRLGLIKNILDVTPFSVGYKKIADGYLETMESFLHEGWENINNFVENIETVKNDFFKDIELKLNAVKESCRTCKHGTKNKNSGYEGTICCWFGTRWGKGEGKGYGGRPSIHEPLARCNNFENG